jgi:hypothetical protein
MGVRLKRFPEYDVALEVFSGKITLELLYRHLSLLREDDPTRFIIYVDPAADLSSLTAETVMEFGRADAARQRKLKLLNNLTAYVSPPGPVAQVVDFWCQYVQLIDDYPATPALFSDLNAACVWLGLPEAAREALTEEIEAHAVDRPAPLAETERAAPGQRA